MWIRRSGSNNRKGPTTIRVGILTSGGDCRGLNAAIRAVGKALYEKLGDDVAISGICDGYRGLMEDDYWEVPPRDFSDILTLGGTILGTSCQPFKEICSLEGSQSEKAEQMKKNYRKLRLDCTATLGGNGIHKTANLFSGEGLNAVIPPKTIDNDLWNTEMTFGFSSTVEIVSMVIDSIHGTAVSHGRVFIAELMGHKVGWLTLHADIMGGADAILLPEVPYNIDSISRASQQRKCSGRQLSILVVTKGAISGKEAALSKKELKAQRTKTTEPSLSYRLAKEISGRTGNEVHVTIPGHFQRGGSPCPYDHVLAIRFGTVAAQMTQDRHLGCMMVLQNQKIVPAPLGEVTSKLKAVPLDCEMTQSARDIGISFGDRVPTISDTREIIPSIKMEKAGFSVLKTRPPPCRQDMDTTLEKFKMQSQFPYP